MIDLRDVQLMDKEVIYKWRNSPEVAKYMFTDHHISWEEHDRWFQSVLNDPTRKYWIISAQGEDLGVANLADISLKNSRCHWAFYLAEVGTRCKGVGSLVEYGVLQYVFSTLGLNKLCGEVLAWNVGVLQLHRSFGFVQEGCYRQHIRKGGQYVDVVSVAILRSEWEAKRPEVEARLQRNARRMSGITPAH